MMQDLYMFRVWHNGEQTLAGWFTKDDCDRKLSLIRRTREAELVKGEIIVWVSDSDNNILLESRFGVKPKVK